MRWRAESHAARAARIEVWHPWFAWFPVHIGEQRVWLELVWRRCIAGCDGYASIYQLKEDKP